MGIYLNSTSIHARPTAVRSYADNSGCVTVSFEGWNEITFYCGSPQMALDMETAIKAVIAKHPPAPPPQFAAASTEEDEVLF